MPSAARRAVLAALLLSLAPAQAARITVYAAASLTDAFTELGKAFDRQTNHTTTFQFAGSQVLRTQLERGAPADVFASANEQQFEPLVKAGHVQDGVTFARNRLVIVTPRRNPKVRTPADLARSGARVILADPAVPAGSYTRRLLNAVQQAGTYGRDFAARVRKNVVSEETNVRQVALKVQLGQADAGIVYVTDVTPTLKGNVRTVALPARFNPVAAYPLGVVNGTREPAAARAFVQYVLSAEGQRILRKWGFLPPA